MKKQHLFGVAGLLVTAILPARADFLDGNKFFEMCNDNKSNADANFSGGYVAGFYDYLTLIPEMAKTSCPSSKITTSQMRDVFCIYLKNNPQNRHLPAAALAQNAITAAWPCSPR